MKKVYLIILAVLAIALASCGSDEEFTVHGQLKNPGTDGVILTYYGSRGLTNASVKLQQDGRFLLGGVAPKPSLATLTTADGTLLATLIVKNGDELSVEGDADQPLFITVNGNDDSHQIAQWTKNHAKEIARGDAEAINSEIKNLIIRHPDKRWAAALLATRFVGMGHEALADSLIGLMRPEARTPEILQGFNAVVTAFNPGTAEQKVQAFSLYSRCDSIVTFRPASQRVSLLCFLDADTKARDSIAAQLKNISGQYGSGRRVSLLEISVAADSASWRQSLGTGNPRWEQMWAQGGTASPAIRKLYIPRLPYFVVADSTGTQIYRGSSIKQARSALENNLLDNEPLNDQ